MHTDPAKFEQRMEPPHLVSPSFLELSPLPYPISYLALTDSRERERILFRSHVSFCAIGSHERKRYLTTTRRLVFSKENRFEELPRTWRKRIGERRDDDSCLTNCSNFHREGGEIWRFFTNDRRETNSKGVGGREGMTKHRQVGAKCPR